ncbi:MAG TPA: carboxypeptidase-like regulatory domain-containing protein [Thermoanaerobaculia bacterium]|nr:carboxypeptidase-like regulatory domain-containing protein [Thermoanaerobaculia bacterium]
MSAVLAAFLVACLGLGVASAQPASKTPAAGASVRGIVRDPQGQPIPDFDVIVRNTLDGNVRRAISGEDGGFAFDDLDAGVYDVEANLEGFTVAPRPRLLLRSGESLEVGIDAQPGVWEALDTGDFGMGAEPLRQLFDESELVVLATAGSTVAAGTEDLGEVATDLRLDLVLKGREAARDLRVVHLRPEDVAARPFAAGTQILAFLKVRTDGAYEPVDAAFGLKALVGAEPSAYRERIESLVKLPRDPQLHPDDLAEWLVATTEEPLTRKAAACEILSALDALAELGREGSASEEQAASDLRSVVSRRLAAGKGLESEPSPAMVAAFLNQEQRGRLLRALQRSPTLDRADLTLYEIVKTWDAEAALSWFVRQMRDVDPAAREDAPADLGVQIMESLARELGNQDLQALVKAAQDRLIAIYSDPTSFGSEPALRRRETREAEVAKKLLLDFRQALTAAL